MRLRALTYNVQSFRGGLDAVSAVIAEHDPDVAMLQECGRRSDLVRLAGMLGLDTVSTHRPFNRVRNAVLYRDSWRPVWQEVQDYTREVRSLRRGFLAVHLRELGHALTVVSTHLGLIPIERERHARELTDILAGVDGPVVIGADVTEGPEGPATRWITERFYDAFGEAGEGDERTFPAGAPSARIDHLFVGGETRVHRAWVSQAARVARASDHRPVVANLEIPDP